MEYTDKTSCKSHYVCPKTEIVYGSDVFAEGLLTNDSQEPIPIYPGNEAKRNSFSDWSDGMNEGENTGASSSPSEGSIGNNPGNFHYFTGHLWND